MPAYCGAEDRRWGIMFAVVLAPWLITGLLAALLAAIATVLLVVFFMLVDADFARFVLLVVAALVLLSRCTAS